MLSRFANIVFMPLLLAILSFPALAQQTSVFVKNQPMQFDRSSGTVSVIHFIRLLDEVERERVRLDAQSFVVTDLQGTAHTFQLNKERKLLEWSEALSLLGYVRRFNEETGVVDFRLATEGNDQQKEGAADIEPDSVRLERSLRRPGYVKAQSKYQKVLQQIGLSDDEQARARVDRLGQRIALHSPLAGLKWNFDVIQTRVPNALCTGEGHVLVTTGLLDLDLTDDELAGVLGHEIAHGVRRHAEIYEERFAEYLVMRSALLELNYEYQLAEDLRDKRKVQRLVSKVEEKKNRYKFVVDYLRNRKDYDQDEEEEADVLGMQYAVAAGFDSEGEERALVKLKAKAVQLFGQSYGDGSRTHPPLDRRLQILETVRRRWRE
jgi:Peptidase family M48